MRLPVPRSFTVLLILFVTAAASADPDAALIKRVGGLLEPRGKLRTLTEAVGQKPEEQRALGFGCHWVRYELFGDALTFRIDAVTCREWVAAIRVDVIDAEPHHVETLRKAWGDRTRARDGTVTIRAQKRDEMRRFFRAFRKGLGGPARDPAGRPRAPNALADALTELTYGRICYEDGSPPAGRELATKLWQKGSRDQLDAVLVGPNPEGRVYAAEALLRLEVEEGPFDEALKKRIATVLALDIPIRCCEGCEVFYAKASALVSAARMKKGVLCRVLERVTYHRRTYVHRHVMIHGDGLRRLQRLPPPGLMICIPQIDRAVLPVEMLQALEGAVGDAEKFKKREGIPTYVIEPGALASAPKAVRDLMASLPRLPR